MKALLLILGMALFIVSCDEGNCNGPLSCTEHLEIISTQVQDLNSIHIELDSTQTRASNGSIIYSYKNSVNDQVTLYTVVTDLEESQISFDGSRLTFLGWKAGELIVNEEFIANKDCCHIEKLEGPEVIFVQ